MVTSPRRTLKRSLVGLERVVRHRLGLGEAVYEEQQQLDGREHQADKIRAVYLYDIDKQTF